MLILIILYLFHVNKVITIIQTSITYAINYKPVRHNPKGSALKDKSNC